MSFFVCQNYPDTSKSTYECRSIGPVVGTWTNQPTHAKAWTVRVILWVEVVEVGRQNVSLLYGFLQVGA